MGCEVSEFTGAAKRFTESKFDVSSEHTEEGFLCTVRNKCGNLICKVEARTFDQAVNAALDIADAPSTKALERRTPKLIVLPNGDSIRADWIGAIRLGDAVEYDRPEMAPIKPRVIVDFGSNERRYGSPQINCTIVYFDSNAYRDEYAKLLLGQVEEILQGGAQ